jgi:hypothetical protein
MSDGHNERFTAAVGECNAALAKLQFERTEAAFWEWVRTVDALKALWLARPRGRT